MKSSPLHLEIRMSSILEDWTGLGSRYSPLQEDR